MKPVLVTGAGGQLGQDILHAAACRPDLRVIGVDHAACDVTDATAVFGTIERHRPTVVINASAYTLVDRAESEPARAFAVNRDAARHLATVCASRGIPLFHVSTDYVFDGSKATPWRIDDPVAPLGIYGASKLAGEQAIRETHAQHLVLRTSWLFGAHGNNFVRTMVRYGAQRPELRVVADQRGGPTWTGDLAAALLGLAERHLDGERLPWGTYHYGGQPVTTWHAFACAIIDEAFGLGLLPRRTPVRAITTAEFPTPTRRPANSAFDMGETQRMLGLAPPDWRVGLRRVLETWRREGTRI